MSSFVAGHRFAIVPGDDDDGLQDYINQDFIIDQFTVSCHDYNYVNLWGWQALDLFFNTYSAVGDDGMKDPALAKVSLWISNTAQNLFQQLNYPSPGSKTNPNPGFNALSAFGFGSPAPGSPGPAGSAPFLSALCVALMAVNLNKEVADDSDQAVYANGFIALPTKISLRGLEPIPHIDYPLPASVRPMVRGPHTAVVIGHDDGKGVTPNGTDVYCDPLGRVRVRFPWDPGPPTGGSQLPPPFPCRNPASQPRSAAIRAGCVWSRAGPDAVTARSFCRASDRRSWSTSWTATRNAR